MQPRDLDASGDTQAHFEDVVTGKARQPTRDAVERDLKEIRRRAPHLADSGLAATALVLAGELDNPKNSATSKAMCARALHDVLVRLRELLPPAQEPDRLDELASRRSARLDRRAAP